MASSPLIDSTGHKHILHQEARIFLDFAEKEANVKTGHELADIPAKPIVVCTECRHKLEGALRNDGDHYRKVRQSIMRTLNKTKHMTASEMLRLQTRLEDMENRSAHVESELIGWDLAAQEYLAGKTLILGENLDITDTNAFLRRFQQAIRKGRSHNIHQPDHEFQVRSRAARFLSTLIDGGPMVLGDEGFQQRHRHLDLQASHPYGDELAIRMEQKN